MAATGTVSRYTSGRLLGYVLAVLAALASVGILLAVIGKNPLLGYNILVAASFGSPGSISLLILDFIPLFLMTLAFAFPLRAGRYNIGNEGQFLLGASGAVAVALSFPNLPSLLSIPLLLSASVLFGALWAAIPAFLLYKFRVNEIVSTISMNFIAFYLVLYLTTGSWHDPLVGFPQTVSIPSNYLLPNLSNYPRIGTGFLIAMILPVLIFLFITKTPYGYELRAVGANPRAAYLHGIDSNLVIFASMIIGGGLAGLAGGLEVAGLLRSLQFGMQANYGFLSYIPALIAPTSILGLGLISFFIAVIDIGTSALQGAMGVPSELGLVIEALLLLLILFAKWEGKSKWIRL